MPKPLALIFLFAWLTLLGAGLQWGFTNNWTDFNWLIYLTTILGLITLAAAALKPKN